MSIELDLSKKNYRGGNDLVFKTRPESNMQTRLELTPEDMEELRKALIPEVSGEDRLNTAYRLGAYEDKQGNVWKLTGDGWTTYINGRGRVLVYRQHMDESIRKG